MNTVAEVRLWDRLIGAVAWSDENGYASFEYDQKFASGTIQPAPLRMPLRQLPGVTTYRFPELAASDAFHGLPGMLADSLPDKFGNELIRAWLTSKGRTLESFNGVERLCYIGKRGMGALEFAPVIGPKAAKQHRVEISDLVALATQALADRETFVSELTNNPSGTARHDILLMGTSAGGSHPKAIIAYNPTTHEVRSGQINAGPGFSYWLLKFDGITSNREFSDPRGYCAIEYAYSLMAKDAGIDMAECRLLEEHGRRHFMTKRFDRRDDGDKIHVQTFAALEHFPFTGERVHSYEQVFGTIRKLCLGRDTTEQQFRRMVFNVTARNTDDHEKNIAFMMDKSGSWRLSPAYDITYAFDPTGPWTSQQRLSINGKFDKLTLSDFKACAEVLPMKNGEAQRVIEEIQDVVSRWVTYASIAGVDKTHRDLIGKHHLLHIVGQVRPSASRPTSASAVIDEFDAAHPNAHPHYEPEVEKTLRKEIAKLVDVSCPTCHRTITNADSQTAVLNNTWECSTGQHYYER